MFNAQLLADDDQYQPVNYYDEALSNMMTMVQGMSKAADHQIDIRNKLLEDILIELKAIRRTTEDIKEVVLYAPSGPGADDAKIHFEHLATTQ